MLSAIYRWLTSKIRFKGRVALAVEANLRSGQSTAPAELAADPVYIPVPGRAGMFVRTYPSVASNDAIERGILKPYPGRSRDQDRKWLEFQYGWPGYPAFEQSVLVEPDEVPEDEVVVKVDPKRVSP